MQHKNKKDLVIIILASLVVVLTIIIIVLLNINYFKFNSSSNITDKESNVSKEKEEIKFETNDDINKNIDSSIDNNDNGEKTDIKSDVTYDNITNSKEENILLPSLSDVDDTKNNNKENNDISNYSDNDLVNYFQSEADSISTYQESESFGSRVKNVFITIVDFIFYNKEINGRTFNSLTNSAKLKVIKIALSIDSKIDKYFPDYKETIKDKYDNLKGKLANLYLEITASLCDSVGDNTCNQAKEDFNNMKESFGFTWDLIREFAKTGSSKVKDFYELWKNED